MSIKTFDPHYPWLSTSIAIYTMNFSNMSHGLFWPCLTIITIFYCKNKHWLFNHHLLIGSHKMSASAARDLCQLIPWHQLVVRKKTTVIQWWSYSCNQLIGCYSPLFTIVNHQVSSDDSMTRINLLSAYQLIWFYWPSW